MRESKEKLLTKLPLSVNGFDIKINSKTGSNPPKCGFLGPQGTYSEQASLELLEAQVSIASRARNINVVRSVDAGDIDVGVVPVENSTEGNVLDVVREIIHSKITILGEKILPIHHVLFGNGKALENKVIRSHPQAIGQCSAWINQNVPDFKIVFDNSTAEAVKIAAERDELAIGSLHAGKTYRIPIIEKNIEDLKGNTTRFWLIGAGETFPTGWDRTTLLFSLRNRIGLLRDVLAVFADRTINISKIDSFPIGALDEYYFLLSLDGHKADKDISEALRDFQKACLKMRILGSYRKATIPEKHFEPDAMLDGWVEM